MKAGAGRSPVTPYALKPRRAHRLAACPRRRRRRARGARRRPREERRLAERGAVQRGERRQEAEPGRRRRRRRPDGARYAGRGYPPQRRRRRARCAARRHVGGVSIAHLPAPYARHAVPRSLAVRAGHAGRQGGALADRLRSAKAQRPTAKTSSKSAAALPERAEQPGALQYPIAPYALFKDVESSPSLPLRPRKNPGRAPRRPRATTRATHAPGGAQAPPRTSRGTGPCAAEDVHGAPASPVSHRDAAAEPTAAAGHHRDRPRRRQPVSALQQSGQGQDRDEHRHHVAEEGRATSSSSQKELERRPARARGHRKCHGTHLSRGALRMRSPLPVLPAVAASSCQATAEELHCWLRRGGRDESRAGDGERSTRAAPLGAVRARVAVELDERGICGGRSARSRSTGPPGLRSGDAGCRRPGLGSFEAAPAATGGRVVRGAESEQRRARVSLFVRLGLSRVRGGLARAHAPAPGSASL